MTLESSVTSREGCGSVGHVSTVFSPLRSDLIELMNDLNGHLLVLDALERAYKAIEEDK